MRDAQLNPNDHEKQQGRLRLSRLAWVPIPLLLLAMAGLRIADLHGNYGSASLIMALNLIFSMLTSLLIVFLVSRSFLTRGAPGLLMLGCGVLTWGAAGVAAKVVIQGDANLDVTIHNLCVWISALFHFGGALLLLRPRRALQPRELWLGVAYAVTVGLLVLVALAALHGWTPLFFVQGAGGTVVRQFVLGSAIVMFLVTAGLLKGANRRLLSGFLYWYTLALGLIAVGLFGIMIESVFASLLSWAGLAAQYLSGVYMLIAAIASVRESGAWHISLETALRESQERLAAFAAATFEGIVESEAGRILDCNEQYARMAGYSVAELKGVEIASLIAPEDRDRVMANIQQGREALTEQTMLCKDGTRIIVEAHGRPVAPGSSRRHTAIRDITKRRRAQEALRESERFIKSVAEASPHWFYVFDLDSMGLTYVNRPVLGELGYPPDVQNTVTGVDGFRAFMPPEEMPHLARLMEEWKTLPDGVVRDDEYRLRHADGSLRYFAGREIVFARRPDGTVQRILGLLLDITRRKQAEEALRESEVRYRTLFNAIDAGFCVIQMVFDADGKPADYRFLEINAAFEKQTGLHEAQGKLMRELAPAHEAHWFEIYGKVALTGEPARFVNEAKGLNRWYDVYAYRVGAPESRRVAILFNDISAHKLAEAELRRRAEELRAANEELTRFNRITVGRELRIIELKKQVNELHARLGEASRYALDGDVKAPHAS